MSACCWRPWALLACEEELVNEGAANLHWLATEGAEFTHQHGQASCGLLVLFISLQYRDTNVMGVVQVLLEQNCFVTVA